VIVHVDIAIIGAGVVGLATAHELARREPGLSLAVIDKEPGPAYHQSGRNSGVLHSGIYYKPGSLRAALCRRGRQAMVDFCEAEGIRYENCGKVIVATDEAELSRLGDLAERARQNGIRATRLDSHELRELEPHAAGLEALHVPDTGIIDFRSVCHRWSVQFMAQGSARRRRDLLYSARVHTIRTREQFISVETTGGNLVARKLVNCAGLHSDRVARMAGQNPGVRIVPFKGEFYELDATAASWVRHLIYPVPNPAFPFLGVHLTRLIGTGVECGPNALLAMGREAYEPWSPDLGDLFETLAAPGFWRFATRHWRAGLGEVRRSLCKRAFVQALARLVPGLRPEHLMPAPSGIRAQALDRQGRLVDDFVFEQTGPVLSVCNAPSPAATASLAIAGTIADRVLGHPAGSSEPPSQAPAGATAG
jgi:(S)-2-hydroxyglutarate dehydrogenase